MGIHFSFIKIVNRYLRKFDLTLYVNGLEPLEVVYFNAVVGEVGFVSRLNTY